MKYEKPQIIELNDTFEGVYALSGDTPPNWEWKVFWCNHNSGSHSEMEVRGKNNGGKGGNYILVSLTFLGNGIITGVSAPTKADTISWNDKEITLIYNGVFNPNEEIVFGLPSVTFSDPAAGEKTNGSYHTTGGDYCNVEANDAWIVSYHHEL